MSAEEFLAWLEGLATNPPPGLPAGFRPAWDRYTAERDRLLAAGGAPPAGYRPDLPPRRRARLWAALDAPQTNRVFLEVLGILDAWLPR
jgi:hypothetical protein